MSYTVFKNELCLKCVFKVSENTLISSIPGQRQLLHIKKACLILTAMQTLQKPHVYLFGV